LSASSYDYIVIGAGGWGSATLYHLARRGLKVCGIEQFGLGHDRGSSHGESRIIRMAYFTNPAYVPVLQRAYTLWEKLEEDARARGIMDREARLMTQTGLLCFGEPDSALIRGLEKCYDSAPDLPHERLSAAEARRAYPQFRVPDEFACYRDDKGGYLDADACVRTHQRLAQQHGAEIFPHERVLAVEASGDGITVRTSARTLHAGKVIVTTGAFADSLCPGIITAVRKVLFWYPTTQPAAFDPKHSPVWIAESGRLNYYGFPSLDGATIKCAEDTGGQIVSDPREVTRELQPGDEDNLRPFLGHLFGPQIGASSSFKTCLYEKTIDNHFLIDHHPELPNVVLALGGSGHGFKFCSVVGEMAADLAEKGQSDLRPEIFAVGNRRKK
jgi:sarcosine oxidase